MAVGTFCGLDRDALLTEALEHFGRNETLAQRRRNEAGSLSQVDAWIAWLRSQ